MAVLKLATTARNAACDAIVDLCDAGSGAATLKVYSGAVPTTGNDEGTGLLATVTFADPAFGGASSGAAAATDPAGVTVSGTGTAASFVIEDSNGANVMVGDVTATGGGGTLQLATTSLASGGTLDITAFTVTMPAS